MKYLMLWLIMSVVCAVVFSAVLKRDESIVRFGAVDHENHIVYVRLSDQLTTGSDGACQAAGMVMLHILEQLPEGWKIYVTNDWVPSRKNPVDIEWAKVLAEGY